MAQNGGSGAWPVVVRLKGSTDDWLDTQQLKELAADSGSGDDSRFALSCQCHFQMLGGRGSEGFKRAAAVAPVCKCWIGGRASRVARPVVLLNHEQPIGFGVRQGA